MKLKIYGPAQDGMFHIWQIIGPKGGIKGEFFTKAEALKFILKTGSGSKI